MKIRPLLIICVVAVLQACSTTKNESLVYFENIGDAADGVLELPGDFSLKIQPDDELIITVTSLVPEATSAYNVPAINPAMRAAVEVTTSPSLQTYVVDMDGCINFPVLGKLKVAGLSTAEVRTMLENEIGKDVADPYVRVQLANFKINIIGEVKNPGAHKVTAQSCTILEALSMASDLTEYGCRDRIILIREEAGGGRTYHRLNLNDASIFSSPYFYLQQNDVLYVAPNDIKQANSKYNQNNAYKLSVISTVVSACSVVASLVIALAIN